MAPGWPGIPWPGIGGGGCGGSFFLQAAVASANINRVAVSNAILFIVPPLSSRPFTAREPGR
jgi:hypothetical protein